MEDSDQSVIEYVIFHSILVI